MSPKLSIYTVVPTLLYSMWEQSPKTPLGECSVNMANPANDKKYAVLFTLVEEYLMPVLAANASQRMGLVIVQEHQASHGEAGPARPNRDLHGRLQ